MRIRGFIDESNRFAGAARSRWLASQIHAVAVIAGSAAVGLVATGCGDGVGASTAALRKWAASRPDTVLVLAADPSECLSCNNALTRFIDASRSCGLTVRILATRPMTRGEESALAKARLTDPQLNSVAANSRRGVFVSGALWRVVNHDPLVLADSAGGLSPITDSLHTSCRPSAQAGRGHQLGLAEPEVSHPITSTE